jgi:TetR/AcrR family acrAB operon transcriptional repressor
MARLTKLDAHGTRSRILDATEAISHAEGVSNTSLDAVAQKAGATRDANYWHFKNQRDLFDAITARVRLPMEAMLEASGDPD